MARFGCFGRQICAIFFGFPNLQGHTFHHIKAIGLHHGNLSGVICHQSDGMKAQLAQNTRTNGKIALIIFKPQAVIGLNRVKALILQRIGTHFISQPYAAPLLVKIEQNT